MQHVAESSLGFRTTNLIGKYTSREQGTPVLYDPSTKSATTMHPPPSINVVLSFYGR
jgi:hypothetical protein